MITLTLFNKATGAICGSAMHSGSANFVNDVQDQVLGSYSADEFYVDPSTKTVMHRPTPTISASKTIIKADGEDTATFKGIGATGTILIDGVSHAITDSEFDFSATEAGDYTITISTFPFKSVTFTVTAQPLIVAAVSAPAASASVTINQNTSGSTGTITAKTTQPAAASTTIATPVTTTPVTAGLKK